MMGPIQWIEDLEEMKKKKVQKTWRLRREEDEEDIDEVKANYLCDSLSFFVIFSFQMMSATHGIEDFEDMKRKKI